MPTRATVDISQTDLTAVGKQLQQYVPNRPVFIFGSRTTGLARPDSDLDLAIGGETPLTRGERGSLSDAFKDLGLAYRVDVIDLHDARGLFRQRIEAEWVPWQEAEASYVEVAA